MIRSDLPAPLERDWGPVSFVPLENTKPGKDPGFGKTGGC